MDNESQETAKLTVCVFVQREGGVPSVRVTTVPDSVGSGVARAIHAVITPRVLNELRVGCFQFEKTRVSRYEDARIPAGWTQKNVRDLIWLIQAPIDRAFVRLREALSAVPDDPTAAKVVRDLYQSLFAHMVADETITDARPGFCKVVACRNPTEMEEFELQASRRKARHWRQEPVAMPHRVLFVHEGRSVTAYVGVVPAEWPFGSLLTQGYDRAIARVHDETLAIVARETAQALARVARQSQFFSGSIARSFRFPDVSVTIDGQPGPLMRGGLGDA